jgi:hypothetical protein
MDVRCLANRSIMVLLLLAMASWVAFGAAVPAHGQPAPSPTAYSGSQTTTPTTPTPAPVSPTPGATPSAVPAESVSVTDLTLTETHDLIGPGGLPRRPEDVTVTITLAWSSRPGFGGAFDVERATRRYSSNELGPFELIGSQAAAGATGSFLESMSLPSRPAQSCYRVRAVAGGAVGAYSNVACTIIPPSSGPGGFPAAPDTGNAESTQHASSVNSWLFGAAIVLLGAALLAVGTIARIRPEHASPDRVLEDAAVFHDEGEVVPCPGGRRCWPGGRRRRRGA